MMPAERRLALSALALLATLAWTSTAGAAICPADCSNRGACRDDGSCFCEPGWTGVDCSAEVPIACPSECSGRGVCQLGKCFCDSGWSGAACEQSPRCPGDCSGNGTCVAGVCTCAAGFEGLDCAAKVDTCPADCSGRGVCQKGACFCDPGFAGKACEVATACPKDCNGRGSCQFGKCFCEAGWSGEDCATGGEACPKDCSGRGSCQFGKCFCVAGWSGDDCGTGELTCPNDCSGRGVCQFGRCFCDAGWQGDACDTDLLACEKGCNGRGLCAYGQCFCTPGYSGKACEQAAADVLLGSTPGIEVWWSAVDGILRVEEQGPDADGDGSPDLAIRKVPLPGLLTADPLFAESTEARFPVRVDARTGALSRDVVLTGRWDGEYGDGTTPGEWTGAAAGEPSRRCVKYGQCMVFALRIPLGDDGIVAVPGGFPERFDQTASRLVRADYCGTGDPARLAGGPGRQGGHTTVLEDYGRLRPPALNLLGSVGVKVGTRLRVALTGTPGFLASGATALILAPEGIDGGVALDPVTGKPSWERGRAVPVHVIATLPVDRETADVPAELAADTLLLARDGADLSVLRFRQVRGSGLGDGGVRFDQILAEGTFDRDAEVQSALAPGLDAALGIHPCGDFNGRTTRCLALVDGRSVVVAGDLEIGGPGGPGRRTVRTGGSGGIAAAAVASDNPIFVPAAGAMTNVLALQLGPIVIAEDAVEAAGAEPSLLLLDDLSGNGVLVGQGPDGSFGRTSLPADFLAISDLAGGHFIDDWQGETAYLKAGVTLEPKASDACVPALPICDAATASCGKPRLGTVPVRVTLGVRGSAGIEWSLGVRTAPPVPAFPREGADRLAQARFAASTYGKAAQATGAMDLPAGSPRTPWFSLAGTAFAKAGAAEGAPTSVRITTWSPAGADGGFDPESRCLAKDRLGACDGAGLLPAAIITRTLEMGMNSARTAWTPVETAGLAWRDRRDLSRSSACLIPVDPATPAEKQTLGTLFAQVASGAGWCGDLESVGSPAWSAFARPGNGDGPTTTTIRWDGRIRFRDGAQFQAAGGGNGGFVGDHYVWTESHDKAGNAPTPGGILSAAFEALEADVPLARAGAFELRIRGKELNARARETDGSARLLAAMPLPPLAPLADVAGADLGLAFDDGGLMIQPVLRLVPAHDLAAACPEVGCSVDLLLPPVASLGGSAPRRRALVDAADAFWRDREDFPWNRVRKLVRKFPQATVPVSVGDAALATLAAPFLEAARAAGATLSVRVPVQAFELTPTCAPKQSCPVYRGEVAALARHEAAGSVRLTSATLWSPDGTARETRVNTLSENAKKDQEMVRALDGNPALRVAQVTVTTTPTEAARLLSEGVADAAARASGTLLSAPLAAPRNAAPDRWLGVSRDTVFGGLQPDLVDGGTTVFVKTSGNGGDFNAALAHCGWARDER